MISGAAGLFLLGNYGVKGSFRNNREEWFFGSVMITGGTSLFVTIVGKLLTIHSDFKRDQSGVGADGRQGSVPPVATTQEERNNALVTELSSVWVGLGVTVTTTQAILAIAQAITRDVWYGGLSGALLPYSGILYSLSIFGQPRKRSNRWTWFLRLHFFTYCWMSEISYIFYNVDKNDKLTALQHLGRVSIESIVFGFCMNFRASLCRLSDKDLSEFIIGVLFKGGFETTASVLFVSFRSVKCNLENGSEKCFTHALCATLISVCLILHWFLR